MTALKGSLQIKHDKLQNDTEFFAKHAPLYIKDKDSGVLQILRFNKAQRVLHDCLEKQKQSVGWVRAIVIKGRQQGCSTYINGRYYHKSTRQKGKNVFIMAHDSETTELLFQTVRRFHENVDDTLRPQTKHSSRKELVFDNLEAQYRIGTAGNPSIGRGGTVHFFHGSEAAYWANALEIKSGIIESVPRARGTEIILETTANGMDEMVYPMVMQAIQGKGDYVVIFIPWFWQDEYKADVPSDFKLDEEEIEYQGLYSLSLEQMAWRRVKIENLGSREKFMQEYPANLHEAFQTTGGSLIKPASILKARQCVSKDVHAPIIMGVDPGRTGDETEICIRRGREIIDWIVYDKMDQMQLAGIIITLIKNNKVDKCFVDAGEGNGTVDRCHELGFGGIVQAVYFGSGADELEVYANKRAEMGCLLSKWFDEPGANCPDDDNFHKGLVMVPDYKTSSNGRKILEAKEKIKEKFKGQSTNTFDAVALTFAYPVRRQGLDGAGKQIVRKTPQTTMSRFRGKR